MLFLQHMMDYVGANGQKYSEIRLIDMNIDSKPTTKAIYIPFQPPCFFTGFNQYLLWMIFCGAASPARPQALHTAMASSLSSQSSFAVISSSPRAKSLTERPCLMLHFPPEMVIGKENMTPSGVP